MPFKFAQHFPKDCPPEEASPTKAKFFRLISEDPPTAEDAMCYKLRFPEKNFGNSECKACGLSMYLERDDVKKLKNRVPALRNWLEAECNLDENSGLVKHTPNNTVEEKSHHTWWVPEGFDALSVMMVIKS